MQPDIKGDKEILENNFCGTSCKFDHIFGICHSKSCTIERVFFYPFPCKFWWDLSQFSINSVALQEEQMAKEKEAAIGQAKSEALDKRNADRDKLVDAQQKEYLELIANSGSMKAEDLAEKKEDLQRQHKVC